MEARDLRGFPDVYIFNLFNRLTAFSIWQNAASIMATDVQSYPLV
jgi:hypothetical protein